MKIETLLQVSILVRISSPKNVSKNASPQPEHEKKI